REVRRPSPDPLLRAGGGALQSLQRTEPEHDLLAEPRLDPQAPAVVRGMRRRAQGRRTAVVGHQAARTALHEAGVPPEERRERMMDAGLAAHVGLVKSIAARYQWAVGGSVGFDDLMQAGLMGLAEGLQHFDPTRGT